MTKVSRRNDSRQSKQKFRSLLGLANRTFGNLLLRNGRGVGQEKVGMVGFAGGYRLFIGFRLEVTVFCLPASYYALLRRKWDGV
jgi:hypothetical protein